MWKWKLPQPPHAVDQLTSTELGTYIQDLRDARDAAPTDTERTLAIEALGKAYIALNEMPAQIRPDVLGAGSQPVSTVPDDAA